jgi:hypothetical protein
VAGFGISDVEPSGSITTVLEGKIEFLKVNALK